MTAKDEKRKAALERLALRERYKRSHTATGAHRRIEIDEEGEPADPDATGVIKRKKNLKKRHEP
jgi:hypothetical protein